MSTAIILQQVEHEGPGRIVPIFRDFGIPTEVRKLYAGDEVPEDLDEIRVLVVLGGPLRIPDDLEGDEPPFLAQQFRTLQRMIADDLPVLGICLGAQLLAHAAGAKVYPNTQGDDENRTPAPEFGWGPVTFPFPGGTDPIVFGMHDGAPMFHWHRDTFDLPKLPAPENPPPGSPPPPTGCVLLSSTKVCKNQAFRFKKRLFGFQYHFELTRDGIERLAEHGKDALNAVHGVGAVERVREETEKFFPRYERLGNRLLENFVQFLKAY